MHVDLAKYNLFQFDITISTKLLDPDRNSEYFYILKIYVVYGSLWYSQQEFIFYER